MASGGLHLHLVVGARRCNAVAFSHEVKPLGAGAGADRSCAHSNSDSGSARTRKVIDRPTQETGGMSGLAVRQLLREAARREGARHSRRPCACVFTW